MKRPAELVLIAVITVLLAAAVIMIFSAPEAEPIHTVSPEFSPVHSATAAQTPTSPPTPTPEPVTVVSICTALIEPSSGDGPELTLQPEPFAPATSAEEIEMIARTIWGEAGDVPSTTEKAAVAWCILNRVDSPAFPDSITEVITSPMQFHGYRKYGDCPEELVALAADVVERWEREKNGESDVGRVLGPEYLYFEGDNYHNHFRTDWIGGTVWGWSAESPYDS